MNKRCTLSDGKLNNNDSIILRTPYQVCMSFGIYCTRRFFWVFFRRRKCEGASWQKKTTKIDGQQWECCELSSLSMADEKRTGGGRDVSSVSCYDPRLVERDAECKVKPPRSYHTRWAVESKVFEWWQPRKMIAFLRFCDPTSADSQWMASVRRRHAVRLIRRPWHGRNGNNIKIRKGSSSCLLAIGQ